MNHISGVANKNSPIRRLPGNELGKDYVVGDLHGCYGLLEQLLKSVAFDPGCDRLFSVGDLIDRGPDSYKCLQLLEEPWFFAVQGNHEQMLLEFFENYMVTGRLERLQDGANNGFLIYGGSWVEKYFQPERNAMSEDFDSWLKRVRELPLMWVVGEGSNRFHIIHAELLRTDYSLAENLVWLDSDIDRWLELNSISRDVQDSLLWGRILLSAPAAIDNARTQARLSTTFCGHTFAIRPRQVLSHLCIDTGAFISLGTYRDITSDYGLTLFDVREFRYAFASYRRTEVCIENFPRG